MTENKEKGKTGGESEEEKMPPNWQKDVNEELRKERQTAVEAGNGHDVTRPVKKD